MNMQSNSIHYYLSRICDILSNYGFFISKTMKHNFHASEFSADSPSSSLSGCFPQHLTSSEVQSMWHGNVGCDANKSKTHNI